MIAALAVALVVVGAVATLNLILTFAVIRRLRGMTATTAADDDTPAVGTAVGEFQLTTNSGITVDRATLAAARTVVAFLTPGCGPCRDLVGKLDAVPADLPLLVVVVGAGDEVATLVAAVGTGRQVATVDFDSPVVTAFGGVDAFPTLVRVEDGVVAAAGFRIGDVVPEPAAV